MSKKSGYLLTSIFVSLIVLSLFVAAQTNFNNNPAPTGNTAFAQKAGVFMNNINDFLEVIFSPILGTSTYGGHSNGEILLMKALIFVIVFAILWTVLDLIAIFEENTWAGFIIAVAASIIFVRFLLTPAWVETIFLPWTALGITLASFLPLVIYFYFVYRITMPKHGAPAGSFGARDHRVLRKAAWIFAAVVFVFIFFSRAGEIGQLVGPDDWNPAYMYVVAAVACLIFMTMDKTIRRAFVRSEMTEYGYATQDQLRTEIRRKIAQATADLNATPPIITSAQYAKLMKEYQKRLNAAEAF